jgi:hypothetical protein
MAVIGGKLNYYFIVLIYIEMVKKYYPTFYWGMKRA